MLLDKKCIIKSVTLSIVNNREQKTETVVYNNLACDFYKPKGVYNPATGARETHRDGYEVVLPGSSTLVREGYNIELIDPQLGSQGVFIIDSAIPYRLMGRSDIVLQVSLMK